MSRRLPARTSVEAKARKLTEPYLWRAVDQDGVVLDILVQERRDGKAAKRFFRRLLKGLQYEPRVIVTDKLRSLFLPTGLVSSAPA